MIGAIRTPFRLTWVEGLTALLVLGYLSMGRSFAYLGIRPFFIGEVSLAAMLVFRFRETIGTWLHSLMRPGPLSGVAWTLYLWIVYGGLQAARGLFQSGPILTLLNSVIHIYPLYLFVGLYVGSRNPAFLPRLLRWVIWWMCLYGVAYVLVLGRIEQVEMTYEYRRPLLFGLPTGGASTAILAILCFQPHLLRFWLPILLNAFVMLGLQMRSEWLSFVAAVGLWGVCARRLHHVVLITASVVGLLLVGYVVDFKMPSPNARGGEFSARGLIGRAVSVVDEKSAEKYSPHAAEHAATAQWRADWWKGIWKMVHHDEWTMLFGPGYGFVLADLHPDDLSGGPQRTPHSIFMFVLGYTGWVGVALFSLFHFALLVVLYRVYRSTGQPFGLCALCQMLIWGLVDAHIELPFVAIPSYLLLGLAAAPCLSGEPHQRADEHDKGPGDHARSSRSTDTQLGSSKT